MYPVILLAAAILTAQAAAEPAEVLEIRREYNWIMDLVEEGNLYRTDAVINPELLSYPALGNYQEEITLYWQAEAGDRWLLLAVYRGEFAAHSEYAEVLFSGEPGEEEMIFYYFTAEGVYSEYRTWYQDGDIVHGTQRFSRDEEPSVMEEWDDYRGEPGLPQRMLDLFYVL